MNQWCVEMFRRSDKIYQSDYNLPVKMCLFSSHTLSKQPNPS